MNKKNNKKRLIKRRLFIVIIITIILLFIINKFFFSSKNKINDKTILVIGDQVENLENDIIIDSLKNVYLSFDDVKNIYDKNIYYDEVSKNVITTFNKHIAILQLNQSEIEVNDAKSAIKGKLKFIDNCLYIPISDMNLVYDFELNYSNDSNIVFLDSISEHKTEGKVQKNVKLKQVDNVFKNNSINLNKDENVTIFEEDGNKYKVRSEDGVIGYIKKDKIVEIKEVRQDMIDKKIKDVNILSNYSEVKSDYPNLQIDSKKNNVVIPEIFSINDDKAVELKVSINSETYKKYIEWLDSNKINLWATITNSADISNIMLTYDGRKELINNIHKKLIENNYKVLNIDFEKINDINSFYRFIIEITPRLKESGIKTVVTCNDTINEEKISNIVDYLVKED